MDQKLQMMIHQVDVFPKQAINEATQFSILIIFVCFDKTF